MKSGVLMYIYEWLKGPNDSDFFIKDICSDPFLRSLLLYLGIDCNFTVGIGTTVGCFLLKTIIIFALL